MGGSARAASSSMPRGWPSRSALFPASPSARTARREGPRVASEVEEAAMRRALDLAARGLGETSPNPSVGAVILDPSGATVGEGRTAPVGGPHAEVVALAQAGGRAPGGTAGGSPGARGPTRRPGPRPPAVLAARVAPLLGAGPGPRLRGAG